MKRAVEKASIVMIVRLATTNTLERASHCRERLLKALRVRKLPDRSPPIQDNPPLAVSSLNRSPEMLTTTAARSRADVGRGGNDRFQQKPPLPQVAGNGSKVPAL
jgi:hypothetical protein